MRARVFVEAFILVALHGPCPGRLRRLRRSAHGVARQRTCDKQIFQRSNLPAIRVIRGCSKDMECSVTV